MQNQNWIARLKNLVAQERNITALVIAELERVQQDRLFAEAGYSSLFEFCVRELGYSESAAQRRILAMRLTRDVPEARAAIENGSLSLSTISRVQSFSRQQNIKDPATKRDLLQAVIGKSARKTEQYLAAIAPKPVPIESAKVITSELTELNFTVDEETMQMLLKIRRLWAHKNPNYTQAELLKEMAKFVLDKTDPEKKIVQKKVEPKCTVDAAAAHIKVAAAAHIKFAATSHVKTMAAKNSRYIPAPLRREVWIRDQGQCQYKNQGTLKRCESKFGLEIDHIYPYSLGGSTNIANLRLLCKMHNQWRATRLQLSELYTNNAQQ